MALHWVWRCYTFLLLISGIANAKTTFRGCRESQIEALETALDDVLAITDVVNSTMHMLTLSGPKLDQMFDDSNAVHIFKRWFGKDAMFEREYVLGVFERMRHTLLDESLTIQCEHLPLKHYKCHSDWANENYARYEWTYTGDRYLAQEEPLLVDRSKENTTHICPRAFDLRRTISPIKGGINTANGRVKHGILVGVTASPFMSMPMVLIESMAQMIPISAPRRIVGIVHRLLPTSTEGLDRFNEKGTTYYTHWLAWQGNTNLAAHHARSYSHFAVDLALAGRGVPEVGEKVKLKWRDGFEERRANVGEVRDWTRRLRRMDENVKHLDIKVEEGMGERRGGA